MTQHLPLIQENESEFEILPECSHLAPHSCPFFSGRMPVPPGVNHSYRIVRRPGPGGGMRLADTPEYAAFKEQAASELSQPVKVDWDVVKAIRASNTSKSKRCAPLLVRIRCFFEHMWTQDLDGIEKAVIDAAFRYVELDDRYVVEIHSTKSIDSLDPHVEIDVCCLLTK